MVEERRRKSIGHVATRVSLWMDKSSELRRDDVFRRPDFPRCLFKRFVLAFQSRLARIPSSHTMIDPSREGERKIEELVQYSSCSSFGARSRFISFIKRDCQPSRRENPSDTYLSSRYRSYGLALAACSATRSQYIPKLAGYFRLDIPSGVRHGGRACFPGRAR